MILNKSNINKRLFDQQGFKESEMLEFKEIIGLYPYASVFAIAYLRGLKNIRVFVAVEINNDELLESINDFQDNINFDA